VYRFANFIGYIYVVSFFYNYISISKGHFVDFIAVYVVIREQVAGPASIAILDLLPPRTLPAEDMRQMLAICDRAPSG
jgi:hypothetical protein